MSLPTQSRIVVIGGGAIGCSIAFHLARAGERDVLLLEKSGLTHGCTWHAAGLVGQLRSKRNLTRMMQYSAELYGRLEAETGQAVEWKPVGSLRLAASPARWSELKRMATTARSFGFELHEVSPAEAVKRFPLIDPKGIVGALFVPGDGHVEPSSLTQAYARGARSGGVRIVEKVRVTGIEVKGRRAVAVLTDAGRIEAEIVVNAAGLWAREVARMAGIEVPAGVVEHQYVVTEKSARIPDGLPTLRDPDSIFYLKPEPKALAIGGWERRTVSFGLEGIPKAFGRELLPPNMERLEEFMAPALARLPILADIGIKTVINGPIPISPDGEPIMGLAPGLDNFFLACGFTSGIAASGGAGKAMAEWIIDGAPSRDLWSFDVRRFGPHHSGSRYLAERAVESYWRYYQIHWPIEEHEAGRRGRRSPLYPALAARGAVFGSRFGWERPNWFAPAGSEREDRPSFEGRPNWFSAVGEEARAMRTAVGVCDMSSFTKFEISGRDAASALQRIAANDVLKPPGSLVYTQLLNVKGGIEADLTITRLADDRFYVVTGSGFGVRDRNTVERSLAAGATLSIADVTTSRAVIALMGPNARALLAEVADADVSNAAFPYLTAKSIPVGYAQALALRVSYVGELGYELHIPVEYAQDVYDRIAAAGTKHAMKDVGYRAIDSLRLEKRYLYWGSDITPDYTPLEAGLGFAVAFGKGDFVGRAALERQKREGVKQRLCTFLVESPVALYGGEAILRAGRVVGVTSSGGYGHSIGKSVAFGYLSTEDIGSDDYEIESFGMRVAARRSAKAPYDPEGKRLRS